MPCTEDEAALILDAMLGGAPYEGPSAVEMAQVTTLPTPSAAGTEVTGGSYVRAAIDLSTWTRDGVGGGDPPGSVTYPTLDSDYDGDVVAVEFYNAGDHVTRLRWIVLASPMTWITGDTPEYPVGNLRLTAV